MIRSTVSATLLLALYFVAPLDDFADARGWLVFVAVFVVFGAAATWQLRRILRSRYPLAQAVESLALALPLYWLGFAVLYYLMAAVDPATFSTGLTRMSALYFTVTVFSTVGFGDIVAVTDTGRGVVIAQVVANLLVLGLGGRVFFGAIAHARRREVQDLRPLTP